ncbi:MAG: type II toxin-antitoxin system Phd/YefM family antitoxin [Anaerolineaceae bacterium]|nr:type II toxin-antitoxin system Phd/YefM family antitoxin [Anaerolineaceae bacterium]
MKQKFNSAYGDFKVIEKSFSEVNSNFLEILDQVSHTKTVCLVQRNQKEDVAMIAKSELDSLLETLYLLKSPENAKRLLSALDRAINNKEI